MYALLVTATLAVVGGLSYELTRAHLRRSLGQQMLSTAGSFRHAAGSVQDPRALRRVTEDWLSIQALPEGQTAAVRLGRDEVLTTTGGPDLADLAGDRSDELLAASAPRWWELGGAEGGVRALSVPLRLDGRQRGTFVVASSRASVQRTLSTLATGIAWASASGLAFALLVGVAGVRRSLRPLARMSGDVDRIRASGDLDTRVAVGERADEIGRLGEAFNETLDRLQEAFAARQRFIMDASHELKTPLTVARGALELLSGSLDDPDARRSAGLVTEELDRMRHIVEDLLLLTRLEEGMTLAREVVDVELVVNEAVLRGATLASGRVEGDCQQELNALADPQRLLQVLTNLVANALQHGGPDVRVTVRGRAAGDKVAVDVSDDGPGIPSEDLPYVFERLYRGSSARASGSKGAGLGLAIARSLVEAMGGRISAANSRSGGSVFSLELHRAP